MSRRQQRSAFNQVSEFKRGRIVAYRDFGLTFREISSRVGQNKTTSDSSLETPWREDAEQVMPRYTGSAPGIMVWVGIGYHLRTSLVRIPGAVNRQRYIFELLEPVVLPYLQGLVIAIFPQDNA
ncbi:transposable element Tcb1 transposase [Trichonephila clavipes]|nr:transposable element Tcb1 transposase [Trichonephila clavipes]